MIRSWACVLVVLVVASHRMELIGVEPAPEPPAQEPSPASTVVAEQTDEERHESQARTTEILEGIDEILSGLDAGSAGAMYRRMLTEKSARAEELMQQQRAAYGSAAAINRAHIPIMGPMQLGWTLQHSTSGAARARSATISTYRIVDSTRNRAASLQRRLDRWSEKLNKSKFTCGGFDWVAQFGAQFNREALKEYVSQLEEGVIAAAPMALLANFSPTLYEIVKHMKSIAGMDISAMLGDCNAMEQALISAGQRAFRGPGYAECMNDHAAAGIRRAHQTCSQPDAGPYDGFENARGHIVSPVLDQEPIDVVDVMTSLLDPPTRDGDIALYSARVTAAQQYIDEEFSPAPDQPGPGADSAERARYDRFKRAESALQSARANLVRVQSRDDDEYDTGWNRARAGFATALRGVLGSIVVSPALETQFGSTPRLEFRLFIQHQSYRWFNALDAALTHHWALLQTGPTMSQGSLTNSYQVLRVHTIATYHEIWPEPMGRWVDTDLDRVAFMQYTRNRLSEKEMQQFDATWHYGSIMSGIARLEVLDYTVTELERLETETLEALQNQHSGGGNPVPGAREEIEKRFNAARDDVQQMREHARRELATVIIHVRRFNPIPAGGDQLPQAPRQTGVRSMPHVWSP